MMKVREMTTWADRLLILLIMVISIGVMLFLFFEGQSTAGAASVSVQVDGKEVDRRSIRDLEGQSLLYDTEFGKNLVRVENGKVYILESNCPDKLCILQGKIDRPGQLLVCLPNRFIVEIVDDQAKTPEVDAFLH